MGFVVIRGGSSTSRRAPLLVTVPIKLETTTEKTAPLSPSEVVGVVNDAPVAPAMSPPSRRHWNDGDGLPMATTENVAVSPVATARATGCAAIRGANCTVRVAGGELAMLPPLFETTTVNVAPSSSGVSAAVVKVGPVAPAMSTPVLRHWYERGAELVTATVNLA